ncbi:hypothetical protein KUTeg_018145, partial [Tegillarca granosa]
MSTSNKYVLGALGTTGATLAVWRGLCPWLKYDIKTISLSRKIGNLALRNIQNGRFLIDQFEEVAKRRANHPFVIFEDKVYSYEFMDQMANRVANLALTWNLKVGDVVAMMIENKPDFIWTFLGLLKLGLTVAFVNYHLRAQPLAHILKTSEAKIIIVGDGEEFLESVEEIKNDIQSVPIYIQGRQQTDLPAGYVSLDDCMRKTLPVAICKSAREGVTLKSSVCYIFTSGTTGLPKPAIINNARAIGGTTSYQWFDFNENDISYIVTPLYHSAATCVTLFNTIGMGSTVVLRRKFSVRHYWEDCRRHNNNMDGVHKIRVAFGNGLRLDIWKEFQERFKIPRVLEFFGATEGTYMFVNVCDKMGAVARLSPLMGLLLASIPATHTGFYNASKAANKKKLVRNAFKDGDVYLNFGDLFYLDKDYFFYFRDRVGDTFRWKSENVSTREVGDVLSQLDFIQDVNVYGVLIPGSDGKAGMAAIMLKDHKEVTSDILEKIFGHCHHSLPSYARPLFLRFVNELETTETMKHRKIELMKEGFDLNKVSDPLYFMDEHRGKYVPLDESQYQTVLTS